METKPANKIQPTLNQFNKQLATPQPMPAKPMQATQTPQTKPTQTISTPIPQKPTTQVTTAPRPNPTQTTQTYQPQSAPSNFDKKFKIYKPNKNGNGSAVQFDFNVEKKSVFVEAAKQSAQARELVSESSSEARCSNAPQSFDWSTKLSFKMAVTDIAKLLVVLSGKLPTIELFHDPSKGGYAVSSDTRNSTVSFSKMQTGYYFKLSTQGQDGKLNSVALPISEDEAIVLKILLEKAIEKIYGW
ncbi:MAG: hypothetical protein V1722_01295 [Candidatus Micrarchaeota archaeon]